MGKVGTGCHKRFIDVKINRGKYRFDVAECRWYERCGRDWEADPFIELGVLDGLEKFGTIGYNAAMWKFVDEKMEPLIPDNCILAELKVKEKYDIDPGVTFYRL